MALYDIYCTNIYTFAMYIYSRSMCIAVAALKGNPKITYI